VSQTKSTRQRRVPGHPAVRFGLVAVAVTLVASLLFLRDGTGEKNHVAADTDPRIFAGKFLMTGFNTLRGHGSVDDMLALYAPACREGSTGDQLREQIAGSLKYSEAGKPPRVDGIDFGRAFEVAPAENGYVVTLPASKDVRLRVNGQWVNAHEELMSQDLEAPDEGGAPGQLQLEYVDGKLRAGPC
jgi:hypothetical protein